VRLAARVAGEDWTVEVEDQGPGIPAEDLPRVFERFFRARPAGGQEIEGNGLGLAIARGIVELHGGRIQAESLQPHGTRFAFWLPLRQMATAKARRIARQLWARDDVRELFEATVEMVAATMDAGIVSLMLVDPDHGDLVIAASYGLEGHHLVGRRTTVRSGVAGAVAAWGRPLLVDNIETDRRFRRLNHPQYRTKSLLCVPIAIEREVLGVVNVNNKHSGDAFDASDLAVLGALAERIGSAVERAIAHPESDRLVQDALHTVRSVTALRRDCLLGGHDLVRRCRATARALGMSAADVDLVGYVASIHDLGMTRLQSQVARSHPLADDARRELASHPEASVEILRPLEYLGSVRDIILSHHERWDGTGYPRQLRGEDIPLGARILAVADAWESMTRGRPWRAALTPEAAADEIRRAAGAQFDPSVVEAFLGAWSLEGGGR
jgi:putative methionine-R-sulfoxide reductase with GAF domain